MKQAIKPRAWYLLSQRKPTEFGWYWVIPYWPAGYYNLFTGQPTSKSDGWWERATFAEDDMRIEQIENAEDLRYFIACRGSGLAPKNLAWAGPVAAPPFKFAIQRRKKSQRGK